jgi:hypothetical protein
MADLGDPHHGHRDTGDPHERAEPFGQPGGPPRDELAAIHEAPPVGEEIHMPDPSLIPIINAAGVTLALLGVTTIRALLYIGLIIIAVTTVLWVRDTRREIASLPAGHGHH